MREELQKKVLDYAVLGIRAAESQKRKDFLENYFIINLDGIENYGKSE